VSFILDALRKSERERQRQATPGLADAAQRPAGRNQQRWIVVLAVILGVNALLVAGLLLRGGEDETPAIRAVRNAPVPPAAPAPDRRPAQLASRREDVRPLEEEAGTDEGTREKPSVTVATAPAAADQPVVRRPPPAAITPPAPARPGQSPPSMEQLVLDGQLEMAPLRLEMHVFNSQPAQRAVWINTSKYRQGDTLKEGPRVEEITADGVILNHQGKRFLLSR
jgi:general secretion pathway protein B